MKNRDHKIIGASSVTAASHGKVKFRHLSTDHDVLLPLLVQDSTRYNRIHALISLQITLPRSQHAKTHCTGTQTTRLLGRLKQ